MTVLGSRNVPALVKSSEGAGGPGRTIEEAFSINDPGFLPS